MDTPFGWWVKIRANVRRTNKKDRRGRNLRLSVCDYHSLPDMIAQNHFPCKRMEEKMSMFTILQTDMEKDCLFFCALCEWTRGLFSDIIKPETRQVQQKLKWELTPLTLRRKERRPMVDMEPAQCGQTVGIRWEAKQRLTRNGMFPPYNKRIWAGLEHQRTRKQHSLSK